MILKLMDYQSKIKEFNIGELENIGRITIKILSGDEIAIVAYKDYTIEEFDSGEGRLYGFYDGKYDIYNIIDGTNYLEDPEFLNRKGSYDFG